MTITCTSNERNLARIKNGKRRKGGSREGESKCKRIKETG
uniref:Uncharacterized protein n=1 Tax=Rhizophora mucronata TaxID=61149 RepID=A0A2P2Q4H4_RHIMU